MQATDVSGLQEGFAPSVEPSRDQLQRIPALSLLNPALPLLSGQLCSASPEVSIACTHHMRPSPLVDSHTSTHVLQGASPAGPLSGGSKDNADCQCQRLAHAREHTPERREDDAADALRLDDRRRPWGGRLPLAPHRAPLRAADHQRHHAHLRPRPLHLQQQWGGDVTAHLFFCGLARHQGRFVIEHKSLRLGPYLDARGRRAWWGRRNDRPFWLRLRRAAWGAPPVDLVKRRRVEHAQPGAGRGAVREP
jgi:hypothetical protein